jgi:hypothetical protein
MNTLRRLRIDMGMSWSDTARAKSGQVYPENPNKWHFSEIQRPVMVAPLCIAVVICSSYKTKRPAAVDSGRPLVRAGLSLD